MTNKTLLRHDFGAGILKSFKNKQKKKHKENVNISKNVWQNHNRISEQQVET